MAIIIKNNGDNQWKLLDTNPRVTINADNQKDLELIVPRMQITYSQQLLNDLKNDDLALVVNDGSKDLTFAQAIWHIFGYGQQLPVNASGRIPIDSYKPDGIGMIVCSHDFARPESWYGNSVEVVEEELTNPSQDGITWRSEYKWWIDLMHGYVPREGNINTDYAIKVEVNINDAGWVKKLEGHDFLADYKHGEILTAFLNPYLSDSAYRDPQNQPPKLGMGALNPVQDKLRATYHHANGAGASTWIMAPTPGKIRRIIKTEVNHTNDVMIHSAVIFCPFLTNPADPDGPKVPYMPEMAVYKGGQCFVSEGNLGTGVIPPFGGGAERVGFTKRGLRHDTSVKPFDYVYAKGLASSVGMELRVWILNDVPVDGEYANVTCYCSEEDDPNWVDPE